MSLVAVSPALSAGICLGDTGHSFGDSLATREECVAIASNLIQRCDQFMLSGGFSQKASPIPDLPFCYERNEYYVEPMAVLGNYNSPFRIEILARTRKLHGFTNWAADKAAYGPVARLFDARRQPKWTQEYAVEVAREFIVALLGEFPPLIRLDEARYEYPAAEGRRSYTGTWCIRWARVDSKGHPFAKDCVKAFLTEEHGPYDAVIWLQSDYEEPGTNLISRGDAIEKAYAPAREIMRWAPNAVNYSNHVASGTPQAALQIVNPNHMTRCKTIEEAAKAWDRSARLAWVVSFRTKYDGPAGNEGPWSVDRGVRVWIDAETGEFLGGDFD